MSTQPLILNNCLQLIAMRAEGYTSDDKELYINLCRGYMSLFKNTIEDLYQRYSGFKKLGGFLGM